MLPSLSAKNRIVGRALDNRLGGFIIAEVLARLSRAKKKPRATLIAVNAVMEEIGGHGAKMAAHRLRPDVCVVLDVNHATETPGIDAAQHGEVKLGGGPSITHGTCNHPAVIARILKCAKKADITIQYESSSRYSGTDTDVIFDSRVGIPSALFLIPSATCTASSIWPTSRTCRKLSRSSRRSSSRSRRR